MESHTIQALTTNILNDLFCSLESSQLQLQVRYDQLFVWVERVIQKKLGSRVVSDLELVQSYNDIKEWVIVVVKERAVIKTKAAPCKRVCGTRY